MKRKTITLVVYMLVCISLVSVGFAAWVITGGDQTSTSGSITATVVEDRSLTIDDYTDFWAQPNVENNSAELVTTSTPTFVFGRPYGDNNSSRWLQYDNDDPIANLSATYTFDLKSEIPLVQAFGSGSIIFTQPSELVALQADGKKYIGKPVITLTVGSKSAVLTDSKSDDATDTAGLTFTNETGFTGLIAQLDSEALTTKVSITITYSWGDYFDDDDDDSTPNLNPYDYYAQWANGSDDDGNGTPIKEDAKDVLTEILGVDGKSYSLTIKLEIKNADA